MLFVQPPVQLLERMQAIRVHLDSCMASDGALRIVPASHLSGRLDQTSALQLREQNGERVCELQAGEALLMRPLTLHASSKSSGTSRRRVLHFLFGPSATPDGLRWLQH